MTGSSDAGNPHAPQLGANHDDEAAFALDVALLVTRRSALIRKHIRDLAPSFVHASCMFQALEEQPRRPSKYGVRLNHIMQSPDKSANADNSRHSI